MCCSLSIIQLGRPHPPDHLCSSNDFSGVHFCPQVCTLYAEVILVLDCSHTLPGVQTSFCNDDDDDDSNISDIALKHIKLPIRTISIDFGGVC